MGSPYDGIILVDKEEGKTSFGVVKRVRRTLKVKKVGHAGTLDPFATGLLIILLGQGTKLSPYLMRGDKIYQATMTLGIETDTQDLTGQVIQRRPVSEFDLETIRRIARGFIGEIDQVPPLYSAVSYRGKRAYAFAREGARIELQKRTVQVYALDISSIDLPDVTMRIACSSGTYVRSLAVDLGKKLGPGAHLKSLRRLSSGSFEVEDALRLQNMGYHCQGQVLTERIIPLREALPHMLESEVDDRLAQEIRNGRQPEWKDVVGRGDLPFSFEGYIKLVKGSELVAIAKARHFQRDGGGWLKIMRVFN